jgi:hypothetical protein
MKASAVVPDSDVQADVEAAENALMPTKIRGHLPRVVKWQLEKKIRVPLRGVGVSVRRFGGEGCWRAE